MSDTEQLKSILTGADDLADAAELPYRIDLWSSDKKTIERLLGRVASVTLQNEHPLRCITLRQGVRVIAASE